MDTNLFTIPVLRNSDCGEDSEAVCSGNDGVDNDDERFFFEKVFVIVGEVWMFLEMLPRMMLCRSFGTLFRLRSLFPIDDIVVAVVGANVRAATTSAMLSKMVVVVAAAVVEVK